MRRQWAGGRCPSVAARRRRRRLAEIPADLGRWPAEDGRAERQSSAISCSPPTEPPADRTARRHRTTVRRAQRGAPPWRRLGSAPQSHVSLTAGVWLWVRSGVCITAYLSPQTADGKSLHPAPLQHVRYGASGHHSPSRAPHSLPTHVKPPHKPRAASQPTSNRHISHGAAAAAAAVPGTPASQPPPTPAPGPPISRGCRQRLARY